MAKSIPEQDLQAIEAVVSAYPAGIGIQDILGALGEALPRRTLQYRLKYLVEAGRLVKEGEKRWVKYMPASAYAERKNKVQKTSREEPAGEILISKQGASRRSNDPESQGCH